MTFLSPPPRSRHAFFGLSLVVIFLTGIWLSQRYELNVSLARVSPDTSAIHQYRPEYRRAAGPQLVLLFVGSSSCRGSNDPELPPLIGSLKADLADYAAERDMGFETYGVAVDWATDEGIQHLASFGEFDEVAVGNNWMNSILLDYVWELDQPLATPAVFVYQQQPQVDADTVAGYVPAGCSRGSRTAPGPHGVERDSSLDRIRSGGVPEPARGRLDG